MSNQDVQVSGSQSAAATVLANEVNNTRVTGQADQAAYFAAFAAKNTGNKLYKNA